MSTTYTRDPDEQVAWVQNIPFIALHLTPLLIFVTGFQTRDLILCASLYFARMFFITAGYHRYFSHRSYKMGRVMQFLMALGGTMAVQKGPLWWAAHHRHHHKYSDAPEDIHSPHKGFWWSHMGWIMCRKYRATEFAAVKDLAKFPELLWLNKYHWVPPALLALGCYAWGGLSAVVVGFCLSTVLCWHGTYMINSLTHLFGRRRYVTSDTSRNSLILALITMGEGWHNNHHYYQSTANQGFFFWEIDLSYYVLKLLSFVGLVRDLRTPPQHVLEANRIRDGHADIGMFKANWARAVHYLECAKLGAGDYYEARKRALDALVESTTQGAQRIAEMGEAGE